MHGMKMNAYSFFFFFYKKMNAYSLPLKVRKRLPTLVLVSTHPGYLHYCI